MRAVWWSAAAFAAALVVCAFAMLIDPRQIEGASPWLKPSKFALSFAVHVATLGAILAWTRTSSTLLDWSVWSILIIAWAEFALIVLQAARGVRSHFNVETPFDAAVFTAMGVGVGALFIASVTAAIGLHRAREARPWPGIVASVAMMAGASGSLTALAMVMPTDAQIAGFEQGVRVSSGSRFPGGGEAAGATVPMLSWSLERGDYRIAHFLGVHQLQIVLIWGWLLRNAAPKAREPAFVALVAANAAAVVLLLWSATEDIGVANASAWMLGTLAALFVVQPMIAALTRLYRPRRLL